MSFSRKVGTVANARDAIKHAEQQWTGSDYPRLQRRSDRLSAEAVTARGKADKAAEAVERAAKKSERLVLKERRKEADKAAKKAERDAGAASQELVDRSSEHRSNIRNLGNIMQDLYAKNVKTLRTKQILADLDLSDPRDYDRIARITWQHASDAMLRIHISRVRQPHGEHRRHITSECGAFNGAEWEFDSLRARDFMAENLHIDCKLYPELWKYILNAWTEFCILENADAGTDGAAPGCINYSKEYGDG